MASSVLEEYKTQRNMDKCGVGWFKFDEVSGNVLDSKGTAIGTITGSTRVTGLNGQGNALSFDGNDYVRFNQKIIPTGKKTIKIDIKFNSLNNSAYPMIFDTRGDGVGWLLHVFPAENKVGFAMFNTGYVELVSVKSNPLVVGKLYTIALTYDNEELKMYVDDMTTPVSSAKAKNVDAGKVFSYNLTLGSLANGTLNYLNAVIDNFEVYNDVIDLTLNKTLIKQNDGVYVYYDVNDGAFKTLGHEPTDEDFLNLGVDTLTQAHIEQLALQGIKGRQRIRRL